MTENPNRVIPTARISPILKEWIERFNAEYQGARENGRRGSGEPAGGVTTLEFRTGVPLRTIRRLKEEEVPNASFDLVDRLLVGMEMCELWFLPPEQGGLADYYGDNPPPPAAPTFKQAVYMAQDAIKSRMRRGRMTQRDGADALRSLEIQKISEPGDYFHLEAHYLGYRIAGYDVAVPQVA